MENREFKPGLSFQESLAYLGDIPRYTDAVYVDTLEDDALLNALKTVDRIPKNLSSVAEVEVNALVRVARINILRQMYLRASKDGSIGDDHLLHQLLDSSVLFDMHRLVDVDLEKMVFDTERFPEVNNEMESAMISYVRGHLLNELERRIEPVDFEQLGNQTYLQSLHHQQLQYAIVEIEKLLDKKDLTGPQRIALAKSRGRILTLVAERGQK